MTIKENKYLKQDKYVIYDSKLGGSCFNIKQWEWTTVTDGWSLCVFFVEYEMKVCES